MAHFLPPELVRQVNKWEWPNKHLQLAPFILALINIAEERYEKRGTTNEIQKSNKKIQSNHIYCLWISEQN